MQLLECPPVAVIAGENAVHVSQLTFYMVFNLAYAL